MDKKAKHILESPSIPPGRRKKIWSTIFGSTLLILFWIVLTNWDTLQSSVQNWGLHRYLEHGGRVGHGLGRKEDLPGRNEDRHGQKDDRHGQTQKHKEKQHTKNTYSQNTQDFTLRHIFHRGTQKYPGLFRRLDVEHYQAQDAKVLKKSYKLKHKKKSFPQYYKPTFFQDWYHGHTTQHWASLSQSSSSNIASGSYDYAELPSEKTMRMPDADDKDTVISLAWMTYDAYTDPQDDKGWVDIGNGWNWTDGFGWKDDGIRGHVFTNEDDSIVVIVIKGTNAEFLGSGGGPTGEHDKANDNMMFSCCCAKVDVTWRPICPCASSQRTCTLSCLESSTRNFTDSYYFLGEMIYAAVALTYPTSDIWFTGHSLGGAVASVLGLTNNLPVFAYESPGEAMFASRLGLLPPVDIIRDLWRLWPRKPPKPSQPTTSPSSPPPTPTPTPEPTYSYEAYHTFFKSLPIRHFGNTGDPVFLGVCNGPTSVCYFAGYAMESKCHLGRICVYDVGDIPKVSGENEKENESGGGEGDDLIGKKKDKSSSSSSSDSSSESEDTPTTTIKTKPQVAENSDTSDEIHTQQRLDIRNHRIEKALEWYMIPYNGVPKCYVEPMCVDCELWSFE